jgi:uncharacterized SAM-binding protein YcdF (DUF218 family)
MFFVFSKIFYFLLMPISWITLCLAFAVILKKGRSKKVFLYLGFAQLILFTSPVITTEVVNWWEMDYILIDDLENYDIAIILTGVTSDQEPRDRVNYRKGADRVLHPIHLYKIGKIKKILVTGGSGLVINKNEDVESENLKKTLLLAGIPETDIILEPKAKNTHENAQFSADILNKNFPNQRYLLVTSAFHMRRALACFQKEGVTVTTFPVDFYGEERSFYPDKFLPGVESLLIWQILIKEWVGLITYKIAGYV